jgi:hypothetical protein
MPMLTNILRIIEAVQKKQSSCEACGGDFICGATLTGCWCSEIKLSDETRAELKSRLRGCLCRKCLEGFAASAIAALTVDKAC